MLKTPLNDFHRQQGARLVDFAGWEMPLMYTSIREEHAFTREHATLFDVSHMGRIEVRGAGAGPLLERLCTRNIGKLAIERSGYCHICREDAGVLDDVIVSRLESHYLLVCNASNREKIVAWMQQHAAGLDVELTDRTLETAMIAIQGPEALETLAQLVPSLPVGELKRFGCRGGEAFGAEFFVARSGYTGEDGIEVILPAHAAALAVTMLVTQSQGADRPVRPAGLGCRDTLRLEAAMPLYGHELSEEWDSITAGQQWCVDLSTDFIGRDALQRIADAGPRRRLAGFELGGRRIARQGSAIHNGDDEVGVVTSGTHSPTLDKVIALGLLDTPLCEPGTAVEIDLRGTRCAARVVKLPFYTRAG